MTEAERQTAYGQALLNVQVSSAILVAFPLQSLKALIGLMSTHAA